MKQKYLLLVLLYFSPLLWKGVGGEACAQDQYIIDSLQNQLAKHNEVKLKFGKNTPAMFDTTAVNILYELSKINWYNDPEKAIDQAKQSQNIAEQIGYKDGIGFAIYSIGVSYVWKLDYPKALEYTEKSLKMGEEIGNKKLVASSLVNIGLIYLSYNSDAVAMKYFLSALKIAEEIGNDEIVIWCYVNITSIYVKMGNYEAVLKTNKAALIIAKKMNDKFLMANCYGNIGTAYSQLDQYSESLKNQIISLKISEELADKNGAASTLLSIGWLYQIQGNYTEALKNHFASLKLYEELENKEGKALIFGNIGHIYSKQKKHQEAMRYLDQSLLISKELKMIDNIRYTYGEMVALDSAQGHFETAFEHYKLFIEARDSLVNENKIKEITQQQMQYEFDKKQLADSLNFERDKEIGAIKLQKQKAYTFGGLVGLAIAIILLFLVYTNFNKQRIANQKLKDAQQQLIQIEREKEAENIRLRISRDIHDDIGHSLTKISLLSDMTANDKQINSPEAVETLGRISNYSRNVNSSLSEIVWAISPKHDSLDSLIVYMRNHIHTFFENTGITYQINFPEANENRSINPDLKRNIFLVLKESLNNILKYAKAKNVTVDFKIDGNQFELKIKDDGVGFSPLFLGLACASREELGLPAGQAGLRSGGNGLPNMKHRIEQTGGSFEINSSVGNGCEILAKGQLI